MVSTTPTLGLTYEINRNWSVMGYAGQTRLSSGIAASPMVRQRTQPLAAVLRRSETRTPMGGRVITLGRPTPLWLLALAAVTLAPLLLVGAAALA